MKNKLFEVRDRGTYVPVLCTQMNHNPATKEMRMLWRAGYSSEQETILYAPIDGSSMGKAHYDAFFWNDRTHHTAHKHIVENWSNLSSGEVIDVEFILGETTEKKTSDF